MNKIYNSVRVSVPNWIDEDAFNDLLALLVDYKDCVQQIAFFSSDFHPPLPLRTAKTHFSILRDRIERAKEAGFSCGINVLSTIGHHPERMDEALDGPWRHMTNIDGEACEASFCPGDEAYQEEYVAPLYRMCCEAKPDFIWIDDDIRYGHIPIGNGCFCDGCIARFNKENHRHFSREALKTALEAPENAQLRKAWLRHQSRKIADLLRMIRRTVNACDDGITLGLMTGERYFEGYDFPLWADALSDGGRYEILWRPGGGAYTDQPFLSQIEKAGQIGRQCAGLPENVTVVQSEIENFPYRLLQKSPRSTALEALLYVSAGCTGAAFNILPSAPYIENPDVMRGHFTAVRNVFPFEKLLSDLAGRTPTAGVYDGWHPHAQAAVSGSFLHGWGGSFAEHWNAVYTLGLPESFDFHTAAAYLLTGTAPRAYTEEELLKLLSAGVYMDAGALQTLNEMGYAELTGFSVGERFREDHLEVYTDHPLNRGFAGRARHCPQVFVQGESAALLPTDSAELLSYLTDFHGKIAAGCALGLYKNKLGGKICVSSHYAAADMGDPFKAAQMKRLFRLLSDDRLPFLPENCVRLRSFARQTPRGNAVILFNPNLDCLNDVAVLYAGNRSEIDYIGEDCNRQRLPAAGTDGKMTRFLLPPLPPFSMALLLPKEIAS